MSPRWNVRRWSLAVLLIASGCAPAGGSSGVRLLETEAAPARGAEPSDTHCSVLPLVRVPHEYPYRASRDELSGWVYLRFPLTPEGRPESITVVEADPPGVFDRAALKAVEQYRYRMCLVRRGRPIEIVLEWKGCNLGAFPPLELEPPGQVQHP